MTANNKLLLYSLFLSVLILIFAPKGKAEEVTLANLSTDVNSDTYSLVVDVDENSQNLKSFYIDSFSNGNKSNRDALTIEAFIKKGFKVTNNTPITFAQIESDNFQADQGGMITIDALYNILNGKRKRYELQIAKDKTTWRLFNNGKIVTKILAIANRVPLAGVVGARELIMQ